MAHAREDAAELKDAVELIVNQTIDDFGELLSLETAARILANLELC